MPGKSRSKISSDRFQEQSSATRPSSWTSSRSSCDNVRLLVGFKTTAEEGTRFRLARLRTSRNFLSLADVHFLGSSCRNSYTMSFGTEGSRVIPSTPGTMNSSARTIAWLMSYQSKRAIVGLFFPDNWLELESSVTIQKFLGSEG